jgi:hypothetical protein
MGDDGSLHTSGQESAAEPPNAGQTAFAPEEDVNPIPARTKRASSELTLTEAYKAAWATERAKNLR